MGRVHVYILSSRKDYVFLFHAKVFILKGGKFYHLVIVHYRIHVVILPFNCDFCNIVIEVKTCE